MKTILLTGFGPFGNIGVNPAQLLVEEIVRRGPLGDEIDLKVEILPVIYDEATFQIQTLIREIQPDILISFGVAARRDKVCPERVALNLKDTRLPDNAGNIPEGELLIPDAPLAYFASLPLAEIRDILLKSDIPTEISNHAGAYICNAVFYAAAHEIASSDLDIQYGFIHIPLIPSEGNPLTISKLVDGVLDALDWLISPALI